MNTRRRALAVLAAGALMAPVVASGTALAAPGDAIPPQEQSPQAFCQQVLQDEPFADIKGTTFERAIECLAAARITVGGANGAPATQYVPVASVQRDAMATFIVRLIDRANALGGTAVRDLPAYDGTPAFTDVPAGDVHHDAIHRLEQAGIVEGGAAGTPATTYSPKRPVTRGQMASFMNRAFDFLTGNPLRTENDYYTDDESSSHEASINAITSEGIAVGDGRKSYSPAADVRRGQMAAFLTRLLGVLEERGFVTVLPPDSTALRAAVSGSGAEAHLKQFQAIADAHDGTRASGTPGYDKSAEYVAAQARSYGYEVTVQEFEFPFFEELAPARVSTATSTASGTTFETGTFTYSGSGDVKGARVFDVDYKNPAGQPGNSSTSGCEASDFAGMPAGAVALIQRGTCTFGSKAANAQAAGAAAVIIYNEGQTGRRDLIVGTLGEPGSTIPVVGLSFEDGRKLAASDRADVFARTVSEIRTTVNVLAESARGNPDNVVMLGAHLDSVIEGPGINDNGTGSAGLLEVAKQAASLQLNNTVRFAWWGAEELGLLGAEHYVAELSQAEQDEIALYLNFDMIGSPNFARFVYDGDDSAEQGEGPGPQGSSAIEYMFADYYQSQGLPTSPTDFSGRSDYGPFIAEGVGIPSGGLFTGAEGIKTKAEEAAYGGTAGVAYDECYHEACDTLANVNLTAFDQNVDAIAHAVVVFGGSTTGTYDLDLGDRTSGPGTETGDPSSQGGLRVGHAQHVLDESS